MCARVCVLVYGCVGSVVAHGARPHPSASALCGNSELAGMGGGEAVAMMGEDSGFYFPIFFGRFSSAASL